MMAADRVPQVGEVWVQRHLARHGRGRVTILDPATAADEVGDVVYRYHGSDTTCAAATLDAFVTLYDFMAPDEQTALDCYGPQTRPGVRRLVDMPVRLGTAVD